MSLTEGGVQIFGGADDTDVAGRVLRELYEVASEGHSISPEEVSRAIDILKEDNGAKIKEVFLDTLVLGTQRNKIAPKTVNQKLYVEAMREYDVVFGIGPAGTGKTYLAMAMAVSELLKGNYSRVIVTRPAVEAGEKLGFLPGDLAEKINPYLRPVYDALFDMVSYDKGNQMIERGVIEVAPLAFMRGRTLSKAFVVLDEAQNTTREQMKMFLTRLGCDSKAVVTGDVTQIDLPVGELSGLRDAERVLSRIDGLAFVNFDERDVVRHPLVKRIIRAYTDAGAGRSNSTGHDNGRPANGSAAESIDQDS